MGVEEWEPLFTDQRMERLADRLRLAFPALPDGAEFVAYINPAGDLPDENGVMRHKPDEAVFAVITAYPRPVPHVTKQPRLMSYAAMWKAVWDLEERDSRHFVNNDTDPAWAPFCGAVRTHLTKLKNLRELN